MKLSDARVGYAGYSRDLSAPGDRRRFAAYADARGVAFERAGLSRDYDVVLVTHNGDIPGWTARKRREGPRLRFIFELADSYFTETGFARRYSKGIARRMLGMDSRLSADFMRTLVAACEAADAAICSTEEQAATIRSWNPNVVVSFDWFADELRSPKNRYERGDRLKLVWEGQSVTLRNLATIRPVLNELRDRIELHVVTDPLVPRYFGRFLPHRAADLLAGFECPVHLHPWDRSSFSNHIVAADAAIIPIDPGNAFAMGKPENKLVMLWQLGMPVLASDTPAYRRTMAAAGLELTCKDELDWAAKIAAMIDAPASERAAIGARSRDYASAAYSRDEFLRRFDRAFAMAGFEP